MKSDLYLVSKLYIFSCLLYYEGSLLFSVLFYVHSFLILDFYYTHNKMVPYQYGANGDFLLGLNSVRERCYKVQEAANKNRLIHFDVDQSKLDDMIQFVTLIIKRDYDTPSDIPVYSRWRHFDIGGKQRLNILMKAWSSQGLSTLEQTKRLIDILVVACLMDMKPCQSYCYMESATGRVLKRKDGIAVALLDMFNSGVFSTDPSQPHRVDCKLIRVKK